MPKHLIISGAPSTGKSSLIKRLRQLHPSLEQKCIFITDGGRWWMEQYEKKSGKSLKIEELSLEDRARMQWEIFEYYTHHAEVAKTLEKIIVADAFYAEVLAYSLDCLSPEQMNTIEERLYEYEHNIEVVVLPMVQIPLEIDGLRHESEDFREEVEQTILETYNKYNIPFTELHTSELDERVEIVASMLTF